MDYPSPLLETDQEAELQQITLYGQTPALRRRAMILLSYHKGLPTRQVAQEVGMSSRRVRYWKRLFKLQGMGIFNPGRRAPAKQPSPTQETQPSEGEMILKNATPIPPAGQAEAANESPPSQPMQSGVVEEIAAQTISKPQSRKPAKAKRKKKSLPETVENDEASQLEASESGQNTQREALIDELETAEFEAYLEDSTGKDLPFPEPLAEPGLLPIDTLAEAGRKTLLYHFAEMLRHEQGTRLGEDIEELHDMRVATRRMRAAFDLFEQAFDPKVIRRHMKGLKGAGRALGAVRDMDVFIEKAYVYIEDLSPDQRQGLDVLVEAWQSQRETAREAMLAHLDSPDYAAFKRKFNNFLQTPGKGVRLLSTECPVPPMARDAAPVLIYSRFGAVRAYDQLLENATLEQLHALRIEFKKLRYAVEFFREILGKEAKAVINILKTMQDHLGDLNDAQVATQLLSDFLARMETSHSDLPLSERRNPEPVVVYLAAKHAERHRLMLTFPAAWEQFNQPEFRQNLAMAVAVL